MQEREPRRRLHDGLAWLLGPLQGASALTGTSSVLYQTDMEGFHGQAFPPYN